MPSFGWRLARRLLKQRRTWRIWRCWELGQPLLPRWITRPGWGSVQASRGAYMSTRTFYVNWDYHASVLLPLWCAVLKNSNLHASCSWFFRSSLATEKTSKHQLGHLISFTSWNPATQTSWQMYFLQPECLLVWIMLGNLASQTLQFSPQQVLREGKCQETQMGDLVRCRIGCGLGGFDFDWWQVFARK